MDGRCRLEALQLAGIELPAAMAESYEGNDPVGWIISANIHRRHLTKQQRADAIVAALAVTEPADDNAEKPGQVEPVSKGGRGKVNEARAKAVSIGAAHGISESTMKRSLATAAGKKANRKEPTGELDLGSIVFPRSQLQTITKAKFAVMASKLSEIQSIAGANSLIPYREHADSLAKIKSAAEANSE